MIESKKWENSNKEPRYQRFLVCANLATTHAQRSPSKKWPNQFYPWLAKLCKPGTANRIKISSWNKEPNTNQFCWGNQNRQCMHSPHQITYFSTRCSFRYYLFFTLGFSFQQLENSNQVMQISSYPKIRKLHKAIIHIFVSSCPQDTLLHDFWAYSNGTRIGWCVAKIQDYFCVVRICDILLTEWILNRDLWHKRG